MKSTQIPRSYFSSSCLQNSIFLTNLVVFLCSQCRHWSLFTPQQLLKLEYLENGLGKNDDLNGTNRYKRSIHFSKKNFKIQPWPCCRYVGVA